MADLARRRPRRRSWALAGLVLIATACGARATAEEPDGVTPDEFAATVQERLGADPAAAACVTERVFRDYQPAAIQVLHDDGLGELPPTAWQPYLLAALTCLDR